MNKLTILQILRNLRKNKFYSFITIFGLAVGMAVTILIYIFVTYEFSYDGFYKNANRIFRLNSEIIQNTRDTYPICIRLNDRVLQNRIPEIEEVAQFYGGGGTEFILDHRRYKDIPFIYADPTLFKVFSIKFIQGDPQNAINKPFTLVLTKTIANRIFGTIQVIGKTLKENNNLYTITAVIEDIPLNSHLQFGAITSAESNAFMNKVSSIEFSTYVLFKEKCNLKQGLEKTRNVYNLMLNDRFKESGFHVNSFLQNLRDIHLTSDFHSKAGSDAPLKKLYLYISLAFVVLLIAIINFINLLTAQYENKSKEIGVQKAIGASRSNIAMQFIGKSVIFSFIALIFACILVELLIPSFGNLIHCNLIPAYRSGFSLLIVLPVLAILVGIVSGLYPALFISGYSPSLAIRGEGQGMIKSNKFTKALVILQFSISVFLISCLITINDQIAFMKNADLGFNAKKVIALADLNQKLTDSYIAIKDALGRLPEVTMVCASDHLLGGGFSGQGLTVVGQTPRKEYPINEYRILPGYLETFEFKFLMGRPFDEKIESDRHGIVLNESAVRLLGLKDPLNSQVVMHDFNMPVLGVVKDFHYASFEENIEPIAFTYYRSNPRWIMVKLTIENYTKILPKIEAVLRQFDPDYEINYLIIDDVCRNRYKSQEQTESLSTFTAILSLLLSLLGLYAMAMFMIQKRTREIGIRKVNGASRFQIMQLFLRLYIRQVLVSFLIAAPVSYFVLSRWLNDFAYRIKLTPFPMVLAGILAVIVAVLTVAGQTWRASGQNPVESLKHE